MEIFSFLQVEPELLAENMAPVEPFEPVEKKVAADTAAVVLVVAVVVVALLVVIVLLLVIVILVVVVALFVSEPGMYLLAEDFGIALLFYSNSFFAFILLLRFIAGKIVFTGNFSFSQSQVLRHLMLYQYLVQRLFILISSR